MITKERAQAVLALLLGAIVLTGLALLASACGSSGAHVASLGRTTTTGSSQAASSSTDDPELARIKFAQCMRRHGVDIPDPTTSAGGGQRFQRARITADPKTLERAQKACGSLLPQNPNLDNPERRAEIQDQLVKFARCGRSDFLRTPYTAFRPLSAGRALIWASR